MKALVALLIISSVAAFANCTETLAYPEWQNIDGTGRGFGSSGMRRETVLTTYRLPDCNGMVRGVSVKVTIFANSPDAQPHTFVSITLGSSQTEGLPVTSSGSAIIPKGTGTVTLTATITAAFASTFSTSPRLDIGATSGCYGSFGVCLGGPDAVYSILSVEVTWDLYTGCFLKPYSQPAGPVDINVHVGLSVQIFGSEPVAGRTVNFTVVAAPIAGNNILRENNVAADSSGIATAYISKRAVGEYKVAASAEGCTPTSVNLSMTLVCIRSATAGLFDPTPTETYYGSLTSALTEISGAVEVTADPSLLATAPLRGISGVTADGVTQAVLRVHGCPNTTYGISLFDESGRAPNNYKDSVGEIAKPGSSLFAGTLLASTDHDGFAAIVYRAPSDYVRTSADIDTATRSIAIRIARSGNVEQDLSVEIHRPQVVLVHGLWGSSADWDSVTEAFEATTFSVVLFDYSELIGPNLAYTQPEYPEETTNKARGSSLGFSFGAEKLLSELPSLIRRYRHGENRTQRQIAASQVDIVAHSMGGLVTRTMHQNAASYNLHNFGRGAVHKLITIGSPHLGSPLATELLADGNECFRKYFSGYGNHIFEKVYYSRLYSGGVRDLSPGSNALKLVRNTPRYPLMTAMIAGNISQDQLEGVNFPPIKVLFLKNVVCGSDSASNKLNSSDLPTLLTSKSDGIVPLSSALNGTERSAGTFPAIHSKGTADLGFTGPWLLGDSGVIDRLINLLHTPISLSTVYAGIE